MIYRITILFIFLTGTLFAQLPETTEFDSYPENYSYDLVADRLSCIQGDVQLEFNKKVFAFIDYFIVRNRAYTKDVIAKQSLYFPIMEEYLAKYNLPDELKYLSVVESGLNAQAISRAGAGGLWQFMPYTGRSYALHQDWYIDERFDPHQATEAACKYLSMLYNMFGDWELALAAYNSGPGNVRKAIRRSGYKKNFWEIYRYLPRETRSYVPQYVAITYAFNYAEEHNLLTIEPMYLMASDTIMIDGFMNLKILAENLDVCYDDIKKLNPNLKRYGVKTNGLSYPINIPEDKIDAFRDNRSEIIAATSTIGLKELEYMSRNSVGSTFGRDKVVYKVRSGDVLGTIAERYRVRVSDIKKWNRLNSNMIRVGQRLDIWLYPGTKTRAVASTKKKVNPITIDYNGKKVYTVQPGDTLWDIANKYKGLDIDKIKKLNNLKNSKIMPGQKLIIG
ncbi:MAG: lytic transglycosylase [Bacteroidetes bacterium]|nr:MAG: lytic transglycosylase [Bacteroidota bacterium]